MKIGFINNFGNYPPQGGSSVHVYQLVHGFINGGHSVHAFQGDYPYENFRRYQKRETGEFLKNIDVLYLRIGGGLRQDAYSLWKWKRPRVPLVWEINAPAFERRNVRSGIIEIAWKMMAPLADAAVCVSKEVESYARRDLGIKNTKVIPNGSDPQIFAPSRRKNGIFPSIEKDDFVVLWAGSSQYGVHGIDLIFDTAEKMADRDAKIKFILMTDARYVHRKGGGNVQILGRVPYLSMPEYIASSDLCLCLYQDHSWSKIGFYESPLKLFDYMSCARPVIASNMGQIALVIRDGENGFLTNNSAEDIIGKILHLKENAGIAKNVGDQARKDIIAHYNWDRAVKETLTLFRDVMNKGSSHKEVQVGNQ